MNFFGTFRKSVRDVKISTEIAKLRLKYEEAIAHKLKMREVMKRIIMTWMNTKLSRYWRQWKFLKFLPTSYETMKQKWQEEVAKMRRMISESVKSSKDKAAHQVFNIAKRVKIERITSAKLISDRKTKEIRIKTAKVESLRKRLKTGTQSSREKLMLMRISSANKIRCDSRMRLTSSKLT